MTALPPFRVLHVAAEAFPLIKTGGLGDVASALPAALLAGGIDTRLLLPGYPAVLAGAGPLQAVSAIGPAFGAARVTLLRGTLPGGDLPLYLIDAPFLYRRDGNPYTGPDGHDWADNPRRFALLGWIAAHLASGELDPDWVPDLVHAHDWHAGLAPAYIAQNPALTTSTVFTVHNLAYRGLFPLDHFAELALPRHHLTPAKMEFHGQLSFLKAGLTDAQRLTTVSPTYADEICTPEFGCGLDGVLRHRRADLVGLLNGIDSHLWNPATDPALPARYSPPDLAGKAACKRALQAEYGLPEQTDAPLFVVVSRLVAQKGIDLILAALPELIAAGGQLVLLGSGSAELEAGWRAAAATHPRAVGVRIGYDEGASHRIMAGADVLLVPSRFEPCGLTQLYALRYGTLPLVRSVGGLADTVVDADPAARRAGRATGFVFREATATALAHRMVDVCRRYPDQDTWRTLQAAAMAADFSWNTAAKAYRTLYDTLRSPPIAGIGLP